MKATSAIRRRAFAAPDHRTLLGSWRCTMKWDWTDDITSFLVPVVLAVLALCLFATPARAEQNQARGVFCDTSEQVEAFVTLAANDTPAHEALAQVNHAAGKETACVFGLVVFEAMQEVKDLTVRHHELIIMQLAIIAVHTPMGFLPIEMTQFMVVERRLMYPTRLGA
jgi:hypothetical protein